jgi:REP element-mobilizing transposase RayT
MATVSSTKHPGHRFLRDGRRSITGQYYHIITCTAERRRVYASFQCGREVVRSLRRMQAEGIATSLAFVVMPDHLHWLMTLHDRKNLSVCVGSMKSLATRSMIAKNLRRGPVWQQGYMDRAIRREADLLPVARYIVANPLRAGLVEHIGEYPLWDSIWLDDPAP